MSVHVSVMKVARTKLRKLPLLPRLSITVELAGRQLTYRQTPMLETLLNLRGRGLSLASLRKVAEEELAEIKLPPLKASVKEAVAKGVAQIKSLKDKAGATAKPVRKPQAKAAAAKKRDAAPVVEAQPVG